MVLPVSGNVSYDSIKHSVEEFASRTLLPMAGGLAGTILLAPIPFGGSIIGSALGSAYGLKIHQEHFDGKISKGALAATFAISYLSGTLAMSALLLGSTVGISALVARSATNVFIGGVARAGDALDDTEADDIWSLAAKILNPSAVVGDIVLGGVAEKLFGTLHAEARPAYREKLLQVGHFDENFEHNLTHPLKPNTSSAGIYFGGRTLFNHGARRAYWQWASLGADWRGGLIGYADTTATTLRRGGVTLKPAANMAAKMEELFELAERENRPVVFLSPGHQDAEAEILALAAFSGLAKKSVRVSMVSATDSQWGRTLWFLDKKGFLDKCYSSLGINRNNREQAITRMTNRAAEGMREGRVGPLILGPGSRGLGLGPLKSGYGEVVMNGVDGQVPLVGVLTTTGTDGRRMVYGDFDFFDPKDLGVRACMGFKEEMQTTLNDKVHSFAYPVHARNLLKMADEAPGQFNRSMASFHPLVEALKLPEGSLLRKAVFKAHVADEGYVRDVILPLYKSHGRRIQQAIQQTPISTEFIEKSIKNLNVRINYLSRTVAKVRPADREETLSKLRDAIIEEKMFRVDVMKFMKEGVKISPLVL